MYTTGMALYRTQILLEERQHQQLERIARESGRSMSELVREIMADYLRRTAKETATQRALAALDALAEIRHEIESKNGMMPESLLEDMREERARELYPW
jgi:metal-responsive CopG/Arc/MetJ family transcriptional regulator